MNTKTIKNFNKIVTDIFMKTFNIKENKRLKDNKVNDKIKENEQLKAILIKENVEYLYF